MRLVLISDTHGQHRKFDIPDGDVLIHAGDFMCDGRDVRDVVDFDVWIGSLPHRHKIVIAGNHDQLLEGKDASFARSQITNATYLEESGIEIDGVRFWGSPYQPEFMNWAFNCSRGPEIKKHWDRIPEDTDVLITHGPPYGVGDQIGTPGSKYFTEGHLGCKDLAVAAARVRPKLHVFGHIHSGYGEYGPGYLTHVRFVNAALLNEAYRPANKPIVVDLEKR